MRHTRTVPIWERVGLERPRGRRSRSLAPFHD